MYNFIVKFDIANTIFTTERNLPPPLSGGSVSKMQIEAHILDTDGNRKPIRCECTREKEYDFVRIAKESVDDRTAFLEIDTGLFEASAGDEGYMLSSGSITANTTLLYFRERRADFTYLEPANVMPVMGMRRNRTAHFVIATGMDMAFRAKYEVKNGRYRMTVVFAVNGDTPYEDFSFRIYTIPGGTYNEMAHIYRNYQIEHADLRPLKDRVRERPYLKYAAESVEFRLRLGWKPSPSPIPHQSPDNEPPMLVACDFERVMTIIDRMREAGVKKAELCLVGWNRSGHDGRFPQLFPVEPLLGGEEKLRELIRCAGEAGYTVVCHDNYTGAYECAENWDPEFIVKEKDGELASYNKPNLSGGICYRLCPERAYEKFASRRLPMIRELGFRGLHFVDVITARPSNCCYDPAHPVNYAECKDWYLKIMELSSELMGGFQSEGPFDFVAGALDYALYAAMDFRVHDNPRFPQCDEMIPFWEIVYHGYILSTPGSTAVNFPIKEKAQELWMLECGGRPLMYLYSKFGKERNWMGDIDLHSETEEDLQTVVSALKAGEDYLEKWGWLQYETIERHEKTADNVFRVTYSDGTIITIDYNEETYSVVKGSGEKEQADNK